MYFSNLCRSIGIPARTTGSYQLFGGEFGGHFWAEFFLPNYGWIPVDTSGAQSALYVKKATLEQKQTFIDFYFGNMDVIRCVVQKDTDVAFIPGTERMPFIFVAVQIPVAEYSMPTGEVDCYFMNHWTLTLDH